MIASCESMWSVHRATIDESQVGSRKAHLRMHTGDPAPATVCVVQGAAALAFGAPVPEQDLSSGPNARLRAGSCYRKYRRTPHRSAEPTLPTKTRTETISYPALRETVPSRYHFDRFGQYGLACTGMGISPVTELAGHFTAFRLRPSFLSLLVASPAISHGIMTTRDSGATDVFSATLRTASLGARAGITAT